MSEDNILCYGDIITIHPPDDTENFIYADGIIKKSIWLKYFSYDNHSTAIFNRCQFQILPQFSNNYKKIVGTSKEKISLDNESAQELCSKLEDEYKYNLEAYNKQLGAQVHFGKIIQLYHLSSGSFLSMSKEEAEVEKENYKILFSKISNDDTFFKFMPAFKYQKQTSGEIILGETCHIVFASALSSKSYYLHLSKSAFNEKSLKKRSSIMGPMSFEVQEVNMNIETSKETPETSETFEQKKLIQKQEVNVSLESSSKWKIKMFTKPHSSEYLAFGDCIWLVNIKKDLFLLSSKSFSKEEEWNLECKKQLSSHLRDPMGMWTIENIDFREGGLLKWVSSFRLRHTLSGLFLGESEGELRLLSHEAFKQSEDVNCQFSLECQSLQYLQDSNVARDAFSSFKIGNSMLYISTEERFGIKVEPSEIEKVFKIYKCTFSEEYDSVFLKASFEDLSKLVKFFQKNSSIDHHPTLIKLLRHTNFAIENLRAFLRNEILKTSQDIKFGIVNFQRQNKLKEQYGIDILIQILAFCLPKADLMRYNQILGKTNNSSPKNKLISSSKSKFQAIIKKLRGSRSSISRDKEDQEFSEMMMVKLKLGEAVFKLLKDASHDNPVNEIYIYKFMPMFQYMVLYLPFAVDFVISLIKNNSTILNKLTNKLNHQKSDSLKKIILEYEVLSKLHKGEDKKNLLSLMKSSHSKKSNFSKFKSVSFFTDEQARIKDVNDDSLNHSFYVECLSFRITSLYFLLLL